MWFALCCASLIPNNMIPKGKVLFEATPYFPNARTLRYFYSVELNSTSIISIVVMAHPTSKVFFLFHVSRSCFQRIMQHILEVI